MRHHLRVRFRIRGYGPPRERDRYGWCRRRLRWRFSRALGGARTPSGEPRRRDRCPRRRRQGDRGGRADLRTARRRSADSRGGRLVNRRASRLLTLVIGGLLFLAIAPTTSAW